MVDPPTHVIIDEMRYTNISGGEIGAYQATETYSLTGQEMETTGDERKRYLSGN